MYDFGAFCLAASFFVWILITNNSMKNYTWQNMVENLSLFKKKEKIRKNLSFYFLHLTKMVKNLYLSLSKKTRLKNIQSKTANFTYSWQFLDNFMAILSFLVNSCWFVSILVNSCQFVSVLVISCRFLSILVGSCQ